MSSEKDNYWRRDDEHWHNRKLAAKKKRFLATLREKATVRYACEAAGIHRATAYRWRDHDLQFAEKWDDAIQDCVDTMETSVYQRGLAGDSILSMFWLKCYRPQFRDRLNIDVQAINAELEERFARLNIKRQLPSSSFAPASAPEVKLLLEAAKPDDANSIAGNVARVTDNISTG